MTHELLGKLILYISQLTITTPCRQDNFSCFLNNSSLIFIENTYFNNKEDMMNDKKRKWYKIA